MQPHANPPPPDSPPTIACWIVTSDPSFLEASTIALGGESISVRELHPEDLRTGVVARADTLLLDWRAVASPEKELLGLCDALGIREPAGLAIVSDTGIDALPGAPLLDLACEPIDWRRERARLAQLSALRDRLLRLEDERKIAQWIRQIAGISLWRLDLEQEIVECTDPNSVGLPAGSTWRRSAWGELETMVPEEDRARVVEACRQLSDPGAQIQLRHRMIGPNGRLRALEHRVARAPQGVPWIVGAVRDITSDVSAAHRLRTLAHYDGLTGFLARQVFLSSMGDVFGAELGGELPISLLYIDLDGFKRANDRHGHWFGDQILRQVAERLRSATRYSSLVPVTASEWHLPRFGRVGGDEFALLLPGVSRSDAQSLAQELLAAVRQRLDIGGEEASVTASVGVATAPDDASEPTRLLRNADVAMYQAKHAGGDCARGYSAESGDAERRKLSIESGLRNALAGGELELHFQPRYQLRTGRVTGAEALLRWQSPVLGSVSPGDFIPVAEDVGLIVPLGDWVMRELCGYVARWERAGMPLRFSFNVSGAQLLSGDLHAKLAAALSETRATPQQLELEVTESVAIQYISGAVAMLRRVQETGVQIALDDFGTGYSSLSVLVDLPLDTLKLDRSIIGGLGSNPDVMSVAGAMIGMAHTLGLNVVAEGVETERQESLLRNLDCDEVQGFRYSRPLPAAEFERLVAENLG